MRAHRYEIYTKSGMRHIIETDFLMKINYRHRLVWFGKDVLNLDDVSAIFRKQ